MNQQNSQAGKSSTGGPSRCHFYIETCACSIWTPIKLFNGNCLICLLQSSMARGCLQGDALSSKVKHIDHDPERGPFSLRTMWLSKSAVMLVKTMNIYCVLSHEACLCEVEM